MPISNDWAEPVLTSVVEPVETGSRCVLVGVDLNICMKVKVCAHWR